MTRTPDEARQLLLDLVDYERRPAPTSDAFRLDGIRALLAALGNPHERVPVVHVAGTKGKGSTSAMIAAGLTACGFRTGLYTSPHISRVEERFRIDGRVPDEDRFAELVDRLEHACRLQPTPPTYFETVTALAWMHFDTSEVDVAVLEVGIGGRLDCTNVCRPVATVITNVGLDHTRLLGETPAAIAVEKAGIVKPGIPCASGVLEPSAREVVRDICRDRGAPLWEWTSEVTAESEPVDSFPPTFAARIRTPLREWPSLRIPLAGRHQVGNAALAVAALDALAERGWAIDPATAADGIAGVRWPLRFETVHEDPRVIVDAAHNEPSTIALVEALAARPSGRLIGVFACARDKDHVAMLRRFVPACGELVLTRFVGNPRAVDPAELEEVAQRLDDGDTRIHVADDPAAAWTLARERCEPSDIVCATGSFFLAAEIRGLLTGEPN